MLKNDIINNHSINNIPLIFEKNVGQSDDEVKFITRGNGFSTFFTSKEIVLTLIEKSTKVKSSDFDTISEPDIQQNNKINVLRMYFENSNSNIDILGEYELETKNNYFIGNDSNQWISSIPTWKQIRYKEVYEGIDVTFYGNPDKLEHDFVINPGADPKNIVINLQGADNLSIDNDGNLIININSSRVMFQKAKAFQAINEQIKNVEVTYKILDNHRIYFNIDEYDKKLPLTIDPLLAYSTFLGGDSMDQGIGIDIDNLNNIYITGMTNSNNFPLPTTTTGDTTEKSYTVFVTKLSSDGKTIIFSTFFGGTKYNQVNKLVVDKLGNIYIAGYTTSSNFTTTPNSYCPNFNGGDCDGFVAKINSIDGTLIYSTLLGGENIDYVEGIAVDEFGNAYVTGVTLSSNFPTTPNSYKPTFINSDAFVTKLDAKGEKLLASTFVGGSNLESGYAIALDELCNVYIAGQTSSWDFFTTHIVANYRPSGINSLFVLKMDKDLKNLIYSTVLCGSIHRVSKCQIAVDKDKNVYVSGFTDDEAFLTTPGAFSTKFKGGMSDVFIIKLNLNSNELLYSTLLGGNSMDESWGLVVDNLGSVCVVGGTNSTNFPVTPNAYSTINRGQWDGFITKLNAAGTDLIYSTLLGKSSDDSISSSTINNFGDIYVAGSTASSDFPTTTGAYSNTFKGSLDVFITKLNAIDISIAKTSLPNPIILGLDLNYKIKVSNNGFDVAKNVIVTDSLTNSLYLLTAEGEKGTLNYSNGDLNWNVGDINPGESFILQVQIIPIKICDTIVRTTFLYDNMDKTKDNFELIVALSVFDLDKKIKDINDKIVNLKSNIDSNNLISELGSLVDGITNKLQGSSNSILTELEIEINNISNKLKNFKTSTPSKLTTGIVVKDISANSIITTIDNTTNSSVTVNVALIDHTKTPETSFTKNITISANSQTTAILGEPQLKYEVVFDGIIEGVYVWVSGRQNSVTDSNQTNYLTASNTFFHNELVEKF